ncbi:MAG: hypothetical protein N5P05_002141 [Chroococcopsis gigantea SAG 12.99]|jgi:Na+/glutamate symporter|nr:hypothetical protein [Chlorogloea purpurea SAG 13.99]MDV3000535.1 hypothetical protein [Chroococcopsis gigantea SAG 12.99]
MSERDGFTGGFLAGAVVGGLVGGILGSVLASRVKKSATGEQAMLTQNNDTPLRLDSEESMEMARRNLEAKIAQLNTAIDDVRQQLGSVNHNSHD